MGLPQAGHRAARREVTIDGLSTSYLEAGDGSDLLLLHSGEYGASAEFSWEHNIEALAAHYRVLAPDWLGFGQSAKVFDFVNGTDNLLSHIRKFCETIGLERASVVGSSLGSTLVLADASSDSPQIPAAAIVAICGGGEIAKNAHVDALFEFDGSPEAMRRVVQALFLDESWAADDEYVARRFRQSVSPGAWECVSAPRFHSPELLAQGSPRKEPPKYGGIAVPTMFVEGSKDKIKPSGWSRPLHEQVFGSEVAVIPDSGHFPQIEQPDLVNALILDFLERRSRRPDERQ